jgi:hypothetical protein
VAEVVRKGGEVGREWEVGGAGGGGDRRRRWCGRRRRREAKKMLIFLRLACVVGPEGGLSTEA